MPRLSVLLCLALLGLAACQGETAMTPTAAALSAAEPLAASPTMTASATMPAVQTATAIPQQLPTITTIPIEIPSPTGTATPLPTVRLGLPTWLEKHETEIEAILDQSSGRYQWQVTFVEDVAATWQVGGLDMALVADGAGVPAGQRPLALAAPFVLPFEGISLDALAGIQTGSDPRLKILPWADLEPRQKALRLDGLLPTAPDYPLEELFTLQFRPDLLPLANELAASFQELIGRDDVVHLAFTGDIMLDRALGYAIAVQDDLAYPFAYVAEELEQADLTIGNLESALGDSGTPAPKSYTFQAPPAAAQALALAGFDIVSLANNHGLDYGPASLRQGLDLLAEQGILALGAGPDLATARAPALVSLDSLELAFLAYVNVPIEVSGFDTQSWLAGPDMPGLAWGTPEVVSADVAAIHDQVDHVIVVLHSGFEYQFDPSPPQQALSRAAIDAGASLVVGHHAHVLQGVEYYNGGVIAYGLGNFAFEIDGDPRTAILNVWLDKDGLRQLEYVPAVIQFGGQPRLATGGEAAGIRDLVYMLTRRLNPGLFGNE